jgi:hypothetical protein
MKKPEAVPNKYSEEDAIWGRLSAKASGTYINENLENELGDISVGHLQSFIF